MAYYDVRTGKRVTNPVLFWIYVTILGICLLRVDSGRVWGAIILVLCFFAWVNIIKEGIKKNKSNTPCASANSHRGESLYMFRMWENLHQQL